MLAYADDIVFLAQGDAQTTAALQRAETWCEGSSLEINRQKSGVMKLRSKHARMPVD